MEGLIRNFFSDHPDISDIISEIHDIRKNSDILNCVYSPTGYDWLGVNIAGRSMFPQTTIELTQYYSLQVISDEQIIEICKTITALKFSQFVFHGFPLYMSKLIKGLKEFDKQIKVLFVYHGFLAELSSDVNHIRSVDTFIKLYREGFIDKVGVVKAGHETMFSGLFGINAFLLYNKVPVRIEEKIIEDSGLIHIGVLVNHTFRKNLHTQVAAALMYPDAIVHVFDKSDLYYFNAEDRIVEHDMMSHARFIQLLSAMHINLHVTYSESFGGQVFTESLGVGVPCITGYSNGFLNYDMELKSKLSVASADDPMAIFQKIEELMIERKSLSERLKRYCLKMNEIADESLLKFITT